MRTRHRQKQFLAALADLGTVHAACEATDIHRATVDRWLAQDTAFVERYRLAHEDAADLILAEAWRRAVEGWEEPLRAHGRLVLDDDGQSVLVRRYSTPLLLALCRAFVPDMHPSGRTQSTPLKETRGVHNTMRHDRAERDERAIADGRARLGALIRQHQRDGGSRNGDGGGGGEQDRWDREGEGRERQETGGSGTPREHRLRVEATDEDKP